MDWGIHSGGDYQLIYTTMGKVYVAKNLIKKSTVIDSNGMIVSQSTSLDRNDEMKKKQEERARRLGLRR